MLAHAAVSLLFVSTKQAARHGRLQLHASNSPCKRNSVTHRDFSRPKPPTQRSRPGTKRETRTVISTRSAHPRTLSLLNQLITTLGGGVAVVNPLSDLTKGEVCDLALEAGLTGETLCSTVSCSHPPHTRNAQLPFHCGYCYACLVRRAGLWHALRTDSTSYQHDPWQLPSRDSKTEDLLALLLWLSTPLTSKDLISDVQLPSEISPADLLPVQHRAREELSAMLSNALPEGGPYRSGWQPIP